MRLCISDWFFFIEKRASESNYKIFLETFGTINSNIYYTVNTSLGSERDWLVYQFLPCPDNKKRIIQFDVVNRKLWAYIHFYGSFLFINNRLTSYFCHIVNIQVIFSFILKLFICLIQVIYTKFLKLDLTAVYLLVVQLLHLIYHTLWIYITNQII